MAILRSACKLALIAFLCLGLTEAIREAPKPNDGELKPVHRLDDKKVGTNIDIGVAVSDNGNNGNQYGNGYDNGYGNGNNGYGNGNNGYGNGNNGYGNGGNGYGTGYGNGGNGNGYGHGNGIGIGVGNGGGSGIGIGIGGGNGNGGYYGPGCCSGPYCYYGTGPQSTEPAPPEIIRPNNENSGPDEFDQRPNNDEKSGPIKLKNENSGPRNPNTDKPNRPKNEGSNPGNSNNDEKSKPNRPKNEGSSPKAVEERHRNEAHHGFSQDPQVQP